MSRRAFVKGLAAGVGYAALSRVAGRAEGAEGRGNNLAWVWQFEDDGEPEAVRAVLAAHGLGILLKTHDGAEWMGRWAQKPVPILGAGEIGPYGQFFESAGVPFHAWCVVEGLDPVREAQMCAEVLSAGARSLTFDLEPRDGPHYWQADSEAALTFGKELRRLAPHARLAVAPDPRPWQLDAVPMAEFASFCNEIAPQTYWRTFDTPANHRFFAERGFPVGPDGVTPELLLNVTQFALQRYGLPIRPVGQGSADTGAWQRFLERATALGMDAVSIWRFGTAEPDLWPLLARRQEPVQQETSPAPNRVRIGRWQSRPASGSESDEPQGSKDSKAKRQENDKDESSADSSLTQDVVRRIAGVLRPLPLKGPW